VPLANTYEKPTFAEPRWVIRNVNRVTGTPTFSTFEPDNPNKPQGVDQHFNRPSSSRSTVVRPSVRRPASRSAQRTQVGTASS
jgi:hypothetical protein